MHSVDDERSSIAMRDSAFLHPSVASQSRKAFGKTKG